MGEVVTRGLGVVHTIQKKRVSTGSVAGGGSANITVVWDKPFQSASYTISAIVLIDEAGDSLRVERVRSKTATQCVIHVRNINLLAKTGEIHVMAVADS